VAKGTTTVKETTVATTSVASETPTTTKGIAPFKEMQPLRETPQTHASNAEKWDTLPEIAQNIDKAINTTGQLTSSTSMMAKTTLMPTLWKKTQ